MSSRPGIRHVLLVATESVIQLAHDLRGGQLEVTTARGAPDALAALSNGRIDCVVVHPSVARDDRLALRREAGQRSVPVVVAKPSAISDRAQVLIAQILGLLMGHEVSRPSLLPDVQSERPRPSLASKTILVVDDDEDMVRALKRTLSRLRGTVVTADGISRALEMVGALSVDLVVSDYSLGKGPTGLDLLAKIRETSPRTRRLLLTGHLGDEGDLPGDRTAADFVLMKPWDPEELYDTCYALLGIDVRRS